MEMSGARHLQAKCRKCWGYFDIPVKEDEIIDMDKAEFPDLCPSCRKGKGNEKPVRKVYRG